MRRKVLKILKIGIRGMHVVRNRRVVIIKTTILSHALRLGNVILF